MRVTAFLLVCLASVIGSTESQSETDAFELIKTSLAKAVCVNFELLVTVESAVFEQTDSAAGLAVIAADGRFDITIGPDQYLYDGQHSYSYSELNNQVLVETHDSSDGVGSEISFITNLDHWYFTHVSIPNREYRLTGKNPSADDSDLPDSLTVYVSEATTRLDSMEFYDINEDRNVIHFLNQDLADSCVESFFVPSFPDSTDVVRF
ncbi:MAG: hypothetical protein KOO62_03810 [candidate division Zixibacteria bacterium]|nr:hypothetical protein [candidate division Zixibacteria bacterium]